MTTSDSWSFDAHCKLRRTRAVVKGWIARLISEAPKSGEVELLSPPISRRLKKDNMDNDLELAIALSKTLMVRLNTPGHAFAPLHLH